MKISSTRKLSDWSCPLDHNLPKHFLHFFVSPIRISCSRSKEMFRFFTYIMPPDETPHHKHAKYEVIVTLQIILLHNTLLKKELKACFQSFSFFHQMIALKYRLSPCYLLHWKLVKNDGKCFLFHLKSSFRSQDV